MSNSVSCIMLSIVAILVLVSCSAPTVKPRVAQDSKNLMHADTRKTSQSIDFYQLKLDKTKRFWELKTKRLLLVISDQEPEQLLFYTIDGFLDHSIEASSYLPAQSYVCDVYEIDEKIVIATSESGLPIKTTDPCGNGFVVCLDSSDKMSIEDQWRLSWLSDCIDKDIVYISISKLSEMSSLYKYSRSKCVAAWVIGLVHKSYEFYPRVFLKNVEGYNDVLLAEHDGLVSCIDKTSGERVWSRDDTRVLNMMSDVVYFDNRIMPTKTGGLYMVNNLAGNSGYIDTPLRWDIGKILHLVDLKTGKTTWEKPIPGVVFLKAKSDSESIILVLSDGIYKILHNKGVVNEFHIENLGFVTSYCNRNRDEVSVARDDKLYLLTMNAPDEMKGKLETRCYIDNINSIVRVQILCFDLTEWKQDWMTYFFDSDSICSHGLFDNIIFNKDFLEIVAKEKHYRLDYRSGKILNTAKN